MLDANVLLITPANPAGLDWPATGPDRARHNVGCHFQLSLQRTPHNAHVVIPVVRLADPGGTFRVARHTGTRAPDWRVQWLSVDAAFRGADQIRLH